ncbi:DMT family transporter [Sutterella sp.]|uniref:DMT family transporter n=1 Tax=Sutterella sp. TaxID=1981025 RepID=UPI0026DEC798|nr:DMT family transporter [Sutterella sp.]MDO5531916.1 DMT family transporter [Sutterella sp.]
MFAGLLFGVLACSLWGLVYVIPIWLAGYDPLLIALARYTVFGVFSAILLIFNVKSLVQMTRRDWGSALALGIIGNLGYYWLLASAVQLAGAPIAGAFTSVIPICVAIVANLTARRSGTGVAWRRLTFPLTLVAAGMVCLNWTEFTYFLANSDQQPAGFWLGVFYAFVSLFIWTWYPISNAQWLIRHRGKMSATFWTAAQGVATLPAALIGLAVYALQTPDPAVLLGDTPENFLMGIVALGIFCSWLGICFWNAMSQRLTPALGGQMIIFETIFAVIYAHIMRLAWPTPLMAIGMTLLLVGVSLSVRVFQKKTVRK